MHTALFHYIHSTFEAKYIYPRVKEIKAGSLEELLIKDHIKDLKDKIA